MKCNEFHEKIIAYLEESLTDKERQSFDEHLTTCESCRQELEHVRAMDSLLTQKLPLYYEEIKPSPEFISRLQSNGPWNTPAKLPSRLWQWFFAPRQSRRIVTVALSAALIISLALLGPRAYMTRTSAVPAPTSSITSSEAAQVTDTTYSTDSATTPPQLKSAESGVSTRDAFTTATPGPAPAPTSPPSYAGTPAPTTAVSGGKAVSLLDISGSGTANSTPFEINTSPWHLQWSVTSGPNEIIIEIRDAETEAVLGEMKNSLTAPGMLDNATTIYNRTGNMFLVIRAAEATSWQVQVIPAP